MRKVFLLVLFLSLFFVSFVVAQSSSTDSIREYEKIVVKEHFNTRSEIKAYIDSSVLDYKKATDMMIGRAYEQMEVMIDQKINKFIYKIALAILGAVFFSGGLWFVVKLWLDKRKSEIDKLLKDIKSQGLKPQKEIPIGSVPKPDGVDDSEARRLQEEKDSLVREYQELKEELKAKEQEVGSNG